MISNSRATCAIGRCATTTSWTASALNSGVYLLRFDDISSRRSFLVTTVHEKCHTPEAAFAKMCGACPIPAGSGKTNSRHRLYRGGNRQANAALYRVVIVRMRWHQPTIDYVARRTAEGMSKREIIRCLKRYLARELFRLLPAPDAIAKPVNGELEIAA